MPRLRSTAWASSPGSQWSLVILLLFCATTAQLQAASENVTNLIVLFFNSPFLNDENPDRMELLKESFLREVASSDDIVFDRFLGPASHLNWTREENFFGYERLDHFNASGANLFAKIGLDSLRTAAIEALPLDLWQDHWLGWLGDLINGTIGNPEEEHVRLT